MTIYEFLNQQLELQRIISIWGIESVLLAITTAATNLAVAAEKSDLQDGADKLKSYAAGLRILIATLENKSLGI
jgi:hypothetical protein